MWRDVSMGTECVNVRLALQNRLHWKRLAVLDVEFDILKMPKRRSMALTREASQRSET